MPNGMTNLGPGPTGTLPGMPGAPLGKRQEKMLGRYALNTRLGRQGRATRAANRLETMGLPDPSVTLASYDPASQRQLWEDTLWRKAKSGAIGGKRAKMLNQQITREDELGEIDKWGAAATTTGMDMVGGQYGAAAQNLQAVLGPDVDMSSPAVASILAGMLEGRQTATGDYLNQLGMQKAQARQQVMGGYGALIGNTLDETGALMEALKQLDEQEDDLASAQRGSFYAGMVNPLRMLGGGIGSLAGGSQGGYAGAPAGQGAFAENLANLSAILSLLGMGGGAQQGISRTSAQAPGRILESPVL